MIVEVRKNNKWAKANIINEGDRWVEILIDGDKIIGDKTYMNYLTDDDVLKWLKSDFDSVEIVEE